jgi:hypothetical protein
MNQLALPACRPLLFRPSRINTMKMPEREPEYVKEAERLALLPVDDQKEIIAMYRQCADNPKIPKGEREQGRERVAALERHLRRLNTGKKSKEKL